MIEAGSPTTYRMRGLGDVIAWWITCATWVTVIREWAVRQSAMASWRPNIAANLLVESSACCAVPRLTVQCGVLIIPGSTMIDLTPNGATSSARASPKPSRANLVEQYPLKPNDAIRPPTD